MIKKIPVLIAALVAVIALVGVTGTASAKGKDRQPIAFDTSLAVVAINGVETNPNSGWTTIDEEILQGLGLINVSAGPAELNGLILTGRQSTKEQFTSEFLPIANVKRGKAKGQFQLSNLAGEVQVNGKYKMKVSSTDACQIYGEGKWKSKAKNSIIDGKGEITVCTNFVVTGEGPLGGFFLTQVSVTGNAALVD